MGSSNWSHIQSELCPNCGKRPANQGNSHWIQREMVCSNACGVRLDSKIRSGMRPYDFATGQLSFAPWHKFFEFQDSGLETKRIRIKILANRVKILREQIKAGEI